MSACSPFVGDDGEVGAGYGVVDLVGNRSRMPVIIAHTLVNLINESGLYLSIRSWAPGTQ